MDPMPPTLAEPLSPGIFLGPALRAQPDRRLVKLVRDGYETAFEEIVRRYRKPLDRFAAAIVGGRSEDVTQDAFSKALLALRGSEADIELKPWLYRIVRNTALNELRDGPAPSEELGEALPGGRSAAAEAERREETAELMRRLRALPEPQRAAIVMRELEGLGHEEIAAALGVSGGAARQAIYRARAALREGFGLLIPLPLLRLLFDHGIETAGAGAGGAVAAAGAASAGGGSGVGLGALGAGAALKVGVATALIAGSVGAGVAMQDGGNRSAPEAAAVSVASGGVRSSSTPGGDFKGAPRLAGGPGQVRRADGSHDSRRRKESRADGRGRGGVDNGSSDDSSRGGPDAAGSLRHGDGGSEHSGHSGAGEGSSDGDGTSGGSHSGRQVSGGGDGGSGGDGGDDSGSGGFRTGSSDGGSSGGGSSDSGSSGGGSGDSGSGSGELAPPTSLAPAEEPAITGSEDSGGGSSSGGSGSGSSGGSETSGSGGGEADS
jgi:RNA polymerase sigma factor (sigma-70 family)